MTHMKIKQVIFAICGAILIIFICKYQYFNQQFDTVNLWSKERKEKFIWTPTKLQLIKTEMMLHFASKARRHLVRVAQDMHTPALQNYVNSTLSDVSALLDPDVLQAKPVGSIKKRIASEIAREMLEEQIRQQTGNEWKKYMSRELQSVVQYDLNQYQESHQCNSTRILTCSHMLRTGYGSFIHRTHTCLVAALLSQRALRRTLKGMLHTRTDETRKWR
ncbi:uncharacterized protein LOC128244944 [Mya arenaria]|uniref:uncharacterized protein LOC128244944 n=1 Tax=Mya arenaria TaxID=6604 RepID=UPI0022E041ED|nr:uncharacterized protein LOC128244944 [Mya arenaria]